MISNITSAQQSLARRRAAGLIKLLDIPDSYYERAVSRYRSFADHLHRPDSTVKDFGPDVYTQGSFRLGTVIRPLLDGEEYDLDMAVELSQLSKSKLSQERLKNMIGHEVDSYAEANSFKASPEEKHRCWRLPYADDDLKFHMDVVPAVPEDEAVKIMIANLGADRHHADAAIAITDDRDPGYRMVTNEWPTSNPRGYAYWFEEQMRVEADRRTNSDGILVTASVDDVPTWKRKNPLQRSIQLLKRHRDV